MLWVGNNFLEQGLNGGCTSFRDQPCGILVGLGRIFVHPAGMEVVQRQQPQHDVRVVLAVVLRVDRIIGDEDHPISSPPIENQRNQIDRFIGRDPDLLRPLNDLVVLCREALVNNPRQAESFEPTGGTYRRCKLPENHVSQRFVDGDPFIVPEQSGNLFAT